KFWVFCFLMLSSFLLAQVGKSSKPLPASAFKLISVKVTGSSRYSSEEIVGASGLQMGQIVHEEDFKKAWSRLGEAGGSIEMVGRGGCLQRCCVCVSVLLGRNKARLAGG